MKGPSIAGPSVEFYGVRGSYPAVGPQFARYGGNTACVSMTVAGRRLVFDGGLGMVQLGPQALSETDHVIFLSHLHYDHLTGLPFYAPLFRKGNRVRIFTPASMVEALKTYWTYPYFPLTLTDYGAKIEILPAPAGEISLVDLLGLPNVTGSPSLRTLYLDDAFHPRDGVMLFRVSYNNKDIVYATDIEVTTPGHREVVARFVQGADLLICDTMYADQEYATTYQGYGHNSIEMTAQLAEMADVRHVVLFHHDPRRDDDAMDGLLAAARSRFPNVTAAYEGLAIQL